MKNIILIILLTGFYFNSLGQNLLAENQSGNSNVTYLTTQDFKQKIYDYTKSKEFKYKGNLPAVIDFYTDWCRPCKMLSPLIESASNEYKGKIVVYKVNIDKDPKLADIFNIQSIPTVLFIPMKGQPQTNIGLMSKEDLNTRIKAMLKSK